jgi:nucleoside-diphosphate-sugar epimerase
MAAMLSELHQERGLDVVRLNPVFVYGPGGLLASAFVDQASKGRLRCIGSGQNWWSCIHVADLGRAYAAAVVRAAPGSNYAVADDEPIRLRELTDLVTDAMARPRVGNGAAWLVGLFIGRPLVASLVTSFRVNGSRIRRELGWEPDYPTARAALPGVVRALTSTSG